MFVCVRVCFALQGYLMQGVGVKMGVFLAGLSSSFFWGEGMKHSTIDQMSNNNTPRHKFQASHCLATEREPPIKKTKKS